MAIIKTLKSTVNDVEQSVYPKTVLEAVVDAETNETLDVVLDEISTSITDLNDKVDNIEIVAGNTTYELSRTDDTITLTDSDGSSSEVDVSDKVSKSGDTMTGDLNVEGNVNVPLLADNTGETLQPIPTAGAIQSDSTTLAPILPTWKTFIGSLQYNSAWHNMISVRHRNGTGNGVNYGMYLRAPLTSTGNLVWNQQNHANGTGTWVGEKTILDSSNYSDYAVPKTGGTFTGDVIFDKAIIGKSEYNVLSHDYYVFHTADGAGKAGYWKLCSITITGTYAGAPIIFHMTSRAGNGTLGVNFSGATDISAYSVANIKLTDNINTCYIGKTSGTSSGSVFDIYVKKEEAYGNLTVTRIDFPRYMRDLVTLTWSGTYVASMPAGITWTSSAPSIPLYTNTYSSIPAATQSAVGLMSAADKTKLDGIATGANKITVDSSLSSTSTNPVQNKAVYASLVARLPLSGGTMTGAITLTDNYGIKAENGNHILAVSSATVSPTSVMYNKKPIYFGFADSNYITYIRGTYVYLDVPYSPVTNKTWTTGSDQRIKTNSILLNDEDKYLTFFDNLKPRNYNYLRDEENANKSIGFYAQEVEEALLSAGLTNQDFAGLNVIEDFEEGLGQGKDEAVYYKNFYTLSYEQFIPIIVNKIQHMEKEFNEKIATLEQKIEELTGGTE